MNDFLKEHPLWSGAIMTLVVSGGLFCAIGLIHSIARQVVMDIVKLTALREPWATQKFDEEEQANHRWRRKCVEIDKEEI